jgi:hypothetical protein
MTTESTPIPLIDRSDFDEILASGHLGRWSGQALDLHHRGFCTVDLADETTQLDCQEVIDALTIRLAGQLDDWEAGQAGPMRVQDAWRELPAVRRLALHPAILDLLRHVYGREPFAFQTLNFAVGSEQPYHSDAIHFHSEPQGFMCGLWIPLADVEPESGPLLYYPGSHRLPYLSAASLDLTPEQVAAEDHPQRFFEPSWREAIERLQLEPEHFLPRRGEALIWHANLLHGGSAVLNRHSRRWSQVVHYFFADCVYTTPLRSFRQDHGGLSLRNPVDIATGQAIVPESQMSNLDLANLCLFKLSHGKPWLKVKPKLSLFRRFRSQPQGRAASLRGNLELISPALITGWVYHPEIALSQVRLMFGSQLIAAAMIDGDRPDVSSSLGICGRFGFQLEIPATRPDLSQEDAVVVIALPSDDSCRFLLSLPAASAGSTSRRLRLALAAEHRDRRGHFDGFTADGKALSGWCCSTNSRTDSIWLHAEGLAPRRMICQHHRPGMSVQGYREDCGFVLPLSEWPEASGRLVWASYDEAGELRMPPLNPLRLPMPESGLNVQPSFHSAIHQPSTDRQMLESLLVTADMRSTKTLQDSEDFQAHWKALDEFSVLLDQFECQIRAAKVPVNQGSQASQRARSSWRRFVALFESWREFATIIMR